MKRLKNWYLTLHTGDRGMLALCLILLAICTAALIGKYGLI